MALFSKKEPVFVKKSSSAEQQIEQMKALLNHIADSSLQRLERDIKITEAGIYGENQVAFELTNSHLPICVLHDLRLEYEGMTSQIDFLVITPYVSIVIECKNLVGNIEVNSKGDFIREFNYGKACKKQGIYSPITQNERHLQLMKAMRASEKGILMRFVYEAQFDTNNKSVVVLANPQTVLNDRFAKKEIKQQIIRADGLIAFIKRLNVECKKNAKLSQKEMEAQAGYWLSKHVEKQINLADKYELKPNLESISEPSSRESTVPLCPKCKAPMVRRTAKRGVNAGNEFWGCGNYPQCRGIVEIEQ